jgi:MATE family multidrug resistance protein
MSAPSAAIKSDARTILALGGPLIANNLANMGMGFADTVMAGQLGARELAGLAIGVGYYSLCFVFGMGVLMGLSPSVAHAYGAQDDAAITRFYRQSHWIVVALSIGLVWVAWQSEHVFALFGIDPEIVPIAVAYNQVISFGLPAEFAFFALRFTSEGLGITRPIMYIAVMGLLVNVLGNWQFIYGHWGFPQLGAVGCALSTAISLWLMLAAMLIYMYRERAYRAFRFFSRIDAPHWPTLQSLLRIGLPIAASITAEASLFIVAAMLMGAMGVVTASAHQIAINWAALMFMIPLAMNSATTIHVGHALGRGDVAAARRAGWVGIAMCGGIMLLSALGIVIFNEQIILLYTRDATVRELAITLLLMAGIFQLSDGLQVGAAGALRGFKDTTWPMAITLTAYWIVGFPIAYISGVQRGGGPVYVWIGLIAGLLVAAILLNWRYWIISRRAVLKFARYPPIKRQ